MHGIVCAMKQRPKQAPKKKPAKRKATPLPLSCAELQRWVRALQTQIAELILAHKAEVDDLRYRSEGFSSICCDLAERTLTLRDAVAERDKLLGEWRQAELDRLDANAFRKLDAEGAR